MRSKPLFSQPLKKLFLLKLLVIISTFAFQRVSKYRLILTAVVKYCR